MAAGKPIVATDIPGYRNVLEDGREGLLVQPESEQALAEAIVGLLRSPELRQQMGEAGRRKATGYDWPIIARQIIDLYERLLQEKGEARAHDS